MSEEQKLQEIQESQEMMNVKEEHFLSDTYTIWFHKLFDDNWKIDAYKKIYSFDTIEQFWSAFNTLIKPVDNNQAPILRGCYFIMKGNIQPMWEAPENLNGSSISYLSESNYNTNGKQNFDEFRELCMAMISNNYVNELNGISVCPKNKKLLFKIWMNNCSPIKPISNEFKINLKSTKQKNHKENIK